MQSLLVILFLVVTLLSPYHNNLYPHKKVLIFVPDQDIPEDDILGPKGLLASSLKPVIVFTLCNKILRSKEDNLIYQAYYLAREMLDYMKKNYDVHILACGWGIPMVSVATQFFNANELTFTTKNASDSFTLKNKMKILEDSFLKFTKESPLITTSKSKNEKQFKPCIKAFYTIKAPDDPIKFTVDMSITEKVFSFWSDKSDLSDIFGSRPFSYLGEKNFFRLQIGCNLYKKQLFNRRPSQKQFFQKWAYYFSTHMLKKDFKPTSKTIDGTITFESNTTTITLSDD